MTEIKKKDELILDLGNRLLDDADKLRLFIPDHIGTFRFLWHGKLFKVQINMETSDEKPMPYQIPT